MIFPNSTLPFPGVALLALLALGGCVRANFAQPDARLPAQAATPLPAGADSITGTAGRQYNEHGGLYRAWLGKHYRRVWAAPVRVPVLDLATAAPGGLTPDHMGGGYQSISLTLTDPAGREYALRALDKEPSKTLPKALRSTFLLNAVRDATSAANPYAALTVPPLAAAAGVPHSHPRLVYIRPDATNLGEGSARFQGKLAQLEEKFEGPADLTPDLAGARTALDSDDMLENIYKSPAYRIDQPEFLRARLLDLLIGDWDRHEGQWQWAEYALPDGQVRYRGIPKDRDQVYYRFDDGVVPWVAAHLIAPKFQTFGPKYGNMVGLVAQAEFIDQRGLLRLTRADFQRTARDLQTRLTDAVLDSAARRLPPAVYALEGELLRRNLRARRDKLPAAAEKFYEVLARRPVLGGSERGDRFVVRRGPDSTTVAIYSPRTGPPVPGDSLRYRRTFYSAETKRITLEGIDGTDVFEVHSTSGRGIKLAIYGGKDDDAVLVSGPSRDIDFYDDADDASGSALRTRKVPKKHKPYDREEDG